MNVEALKKRRVTSLVTKAMQIKTTVSYCYISVRMEKIKSTMPNAGEDAEQRQRPSTAGREVNNVTILWKTVWWLLKRLNIGAAS